MNVTNVPEQMVVCDAAIVTAGAASGLTVMVMLLLVAFGVVTQATSLTRVQLTLSPFESALLKVGPFAPVLLPFTSHW